MSASPRRRPRRLRLLQLGVGRVGSALVRMVAEQRSLVADELGVELAYAGLIRRGRAHWGDPAEVPEDPGAWEPQEDPSAALARALEVGDPRDLVLVDVSAAETAGLFLEALGRGASVVSANKLPLTTRYEEFWAMRSAAWKTGAALRFECTVGAALPVVRTLEGMRRSGDAVHEVEGALSGTLGTLTSALDAGEAFSAAVRRAHAEGLTEPDPRDDLSGMDVARKAVILGRLLGEVVNLTDVEVEGLVPAALTGGTIEDFLEGVDAADPEVAARVAEARAAGGALRYLARVAPGEPVRVGLQQVAGASPWAGLRGADSMLVVRSRRYQPQPLVIRGPGAGTELTAAGVLEDVLEVAGCR